MRDSAMPVPRRKLEKQESNTEEEDPVLHALLGEEGEMERDERDSEEEVPATHAQHGDIKKAKEQSSDKGKDVPVLVTSNSSTTTRNSVNHAIIALLSRLREKQVRHL